MTGDEVTSSVSESPVRSLRRATTARVPVLSWADAGPTMTVVVRCGPVVRGPDLAPAVDGYPPPMALHRWACDGSAGLSRHVRDSILRPTAAAVPRISRRTMIQVIGGFSLPPLHERNGCLAGQRSDQEHHRWPR